MQSTNENQLAEFLKQNKQPQPQQSTNFQNNPPQPVPAEQQQPTQNPLQAISSTVQGSNNTISQLNELVKGFNDLITNASDVFMKRMEDKEKRLNGDVKNEGNTTGRYMEKFKQNPVPNITSSNEKSELIWTWFERTLQNIPKEATTEQIIKEWKENNNEFIKLLQGMIKGDVKLQDLKQPEQPKQPEQSSNPEKPQKNPEKNQNTQSDVNIANNQ